MGRSLVTVAQLAKDSIYTEAQCRWWIFNAGENGLAHAIHRAGSRVLVDARAFYAWRASQDRRRVGAAGLERTGGHQ